MSPHRDACPPRPVSEMMTVSRSASMRLRKPTMPPLQPSSVTAREPTLPATADDNTCDSVSPNRLSKQRGHPFGLLWQVLQHSLLNTARDRGMDVPRSCKRPRPGYSPDVGAGGRSGDSDSAPVGRADHDLSIDYPSALDSTRIGSLRRKCARRTIVTWLSG